MTLPPQPDVSIDVLGNYLAAAIPGFGRLEGIRKFSGGQSNPTYALDASSGRYVLRAQPTGELLKSAHQVDREFRVMQALAESDVPVPRMLHLARADGPLGRDFYVMAHLDGRVFWDPALPECEKAERGAIYDEMNRVLAALHNIDIDAVGLSAFGRPGNYYERQFSRWSKQYRASETEPLPQMDALIDWVGAAMPPDDGMVSLVHGDWRIDNLMFHPSEPRIIGVLDWEISTLGHPVADLAYQCMQWRLPNSSSMRGLGGLDRRAIGLPTEQDYVAAYCARRGLDGIGNWTFYLAFSFFRLIAILQGVVRRAQDGNASNPEKAQEMQAAIPVLASLAAEIIEKES
ncbi:phosphotransferase [Rhodobacteraceae bacterium NNCM2]|nr:phosphotransferase [Coraliihabitans acroporae]